MKTGKQIEEDVWRMLRSSSIRDFITGGIYKAGMRPRNSEREDAIVIFSAGMAEEIESGVVTINIFVPDKDYYGNGQMLENLSRTTAIEALAQSWVEELTCARSNYKFKLRQTITTDYEHQIHQHYVVIILEYQHYGDD